MFRAFLKNSHFLVALVKAFRLLPTDARRLKWRFARGRLLHTYLTAHSLRKLHVGAGTNLLEGWLNADFHPRNPQVAYLDATKPFPFADGTFAYVFSEHMIEHLDFNAGSFFLRECRRVLKPGCKIRIATPDLRIIAGLCASSPSAPQLGYIKSATDLFMADFIPKFNPQKYGQRGAFVLNMFFWHHGHYFAYDFETLELALKEAGFVEITRREPGKSADAQLAGIESHGKQVGDVMNNFETLVVEAVRP